MMNKPIADSSDLRAIEYDCSSKDTYVGADGSVSGLITQNIEESKQR